VPATRRLAAIVFTDIVGYTSLTQTDEAAALRLLEVQGQLVRPLLDHHRGRKVKSIGDGLLLEFPNALDAVEFAVELQRLVAGLDRTDGTPALRLRIGIHLGDVERRGSDILGDAVNIASRIEPLAEPGGICLSAQVYDQIRRKVPYRIDPLGPRTLKGVSEPVEIYRISVGENVAAPSPAAGNAPPRLAVLPLANISPDPKDEYFADGLTEELISVLSQIRGLRVIARTSVSQYRGTSKPIGQIGSELGVSSVLEGSVRKAGDQLRITVQLIDVGTQEHRWAQTYDRKLDNVFAIQAEVAAQTASALKVELLRREREAIRERPTASLAAYEAYLRGIQAYHQRGNDVQLAEARRYFELAIREDPEFVAAHAYLANQLIGELGMARPGQEVAPRARELVARALELDPESSEAHTAAGNLALQVDQDWPRAEAEFQRAISLNPSSSTARFWYGFLLMALQRFDEAMAQLEAGIELDPLWVNARLNLAGLFTIRGEYDRAIALSRKVLEDFGPTPFAQTQIAFTYALAGRDAEAIREVEGFEASPLFYLRAIRAGLLAWLGKPKEARALIAAWEKHSERGYLSLNMIAELYGYLGENDRALALLEKDAAEGDRTFWNHYQSPGFDGVRDDPRFQALLREMHLPTTVPARRRILPARARRSRG